MLNLLSLVRTTPERQLEAAKQSLEHLAEHLNAKVSVRLWDGSIVPLGTEARTDLRVALSGPGVIGSLLRKPTLETVLRLYATGKIDIEGDEWDVLANVNARAEQLGQLLAERIEPLDGVAEVRRRGRMVGVELAPPAEGLRWGRRVSAGCVDRGVLIRPLGDVVVLMPPLTTTDDEVVRIIDALEAAIREVAAG